jgi:hypothetical protein
MLRSLVLILLLVNAGFFAWSQGWLNRIVGVQPGSQHEPQRLSQQVAPDKLALVNTPRPQADRAASEATDPASATAAAPSASAAIASRENTLCLEAGPFNAAELPLAEGMVRPLVPAGGWQADTVAVQGLWMVYMGPYADAEMLARKQAELKRLKGLNFEEVKTPTAYALGFSLGRHSTQAEAESALATFRLRGIRTARVVTLRAPMELQVLRVPQANERVQVALAGAKLPQGKAFTACRN